MHKQKTARLALVICALCAFAPTILSAEWITAKASSEGNVGQYTDIAIDSSGCPHISHYDATNGDLMYSRWNGAEWITERVDKSGFVGRYSSIALDALQYPHIAYYDGTDKNLKYAYKSLIGGVWVKETVDSDDTAGLFCSLALDSINSPHICYYQEISASHKKVKHATKSLSLWTISTIEDINSNAENTGTSILVDSSDKPHVSYQIDYTGNYSVLKYAAKPGATWNIKTVEQTSAYYNYTGLYSSLALGSDGNPRIAYINKEGNFVVSHYLKMALWNGTEWNISTIQTASSPLKFASLVLGALDLPQIAYYDDSGKNLIVASRNIMFNWVFTKIDEEGEVGDYCSMTKDALGRLHISYNDATDGDLKYARQNDAPALLWLGTSRYVADGLHPEEGLTMQTDFDYRVIYMDLNNDAPFGGAPLLHILKGGAEIPGSPFKMEYTSGEYNTGATFSYVTKLPVGSDYTYSFSANDIWGAAATGLPTLPLEAPLVKNTAPVLDWTGEENFIADGINPDGAGINRLFEYRVKYSDADNDAPTSGFPQLRIFKNSVEIDCSPVAMLPVSGDYVSGFIYRFARFLPDEGDDYTHSFEAKDIWGDTDILKGNGPEVGPPSNNGFLLTGKDASP